MNITIHTRQLNNNSHKTTKNKTSTKGKQHQGSTVCSFLYFFHTHIALVLSPQPFISPSSLHCTSLLFTLFHFATLVNDFHFTFLHFCTLLGDFQRSVSSLNSPLLSLSLLFLVRPPDEENVTHFQKGMHFG